MLTIRTSCYSCGVVDCRQDDLEFFAGAGVSWYRFICPLCGGYVTRRLSAEVAALLEKFGIISDTLHIPDEYFDVKPYCPFTEDDVLDFMLLLDSCDDVVGLIE